MCVCVCVWRLVLCPCASLAVSRCISVPALQRDHGAISIVDADVNVDFDTPADYVEPERRPRPAPKLEAFQDQEMPEVEPGLATGPCSRVLARAANPPKYQIMRIVSAAFPRVS